MDIIQATNKFAKKLFKELLKNRTGNVFLSPIALQTLLALVYTGAKGDTSDELARLLLLPANVEEVILSYSSLFKILEDPSLKFSNGLFVDSETNVNIEFQNFAGSFHSSVRAMNFRKESEKSRQLINSWVKVQTDNKVRDFLPPGSIHDLTRLVLASVVHFKARWILKFERENTSKEPFYVTKTRTVPVEMMRIADEFVFTHSKELEAKILQLEYQDCLFQMTIVLPDAIEGLSELESNLESVDILELTRGLERTPVSVSLPRFKLEESMELNDVLIHLGVAKMFSEEADFSGISDTPLLLSTIVQKACVEVDEEGTEATAATAVSVVELCSASWQPEEFNANHPFVFVISNKVSHAIVFLGRFQSPT